MKCSTFALEIVHLKVRDILKDYVENSNILSFFNMCVRVQTFTNTHERRKKSCPNCRENVIDVLYIFSFQSGILQFTSLSFSLFRTVLQQKLFSWWLITICIIGTVLKIVLILRNNWFFWQCCDHFLAKQTKSLLLTGDFEQTPNIEQGIEFCTSYNWRRRPFTVDDSEFEFRVKCGGAKQFW